ncbi:MAG: SMC-Scp complex subunit ScpB [Anaerolineae bacterium]|nr:SMC-Scp complex subunit ScpB [Anaerolineae bacterium]
MRPLRRAASWERSVHLEALIESLLFVADRTVTVQELATTLEIDQDEIENALEGLKTTYQDRGICLQRKGERLQLVSPPEAGPVIERFLGLEISGKLSPAALETIAIVAYRQPITRIQVDAIRGVNSDSVLRSLVRRGLLEQVGRAETVGHPILYGITFSFLEQFGLESLTSLPRWDELNQELGEREAQRIEDDIG